MYLHPDLILSKMYTMYVEELICTKNKEFVIFKAQKEKKKS